MLDSKTPPTPALGPRILIVEQVAEQLRQSEERYRTLFEYATDMILSCALTGEVLSVNREAERLLGCPRDLIIGKHYHQFFAPSSIVVVEEHFQSVLSGEQRTSLFEVMLQRSDGQLVAVEGNARFIGDANGHPTEIWVLFRDISARKQAERLLREEAEVAGALARIRRELMESRDTPTVLARLCQLTAEVLTSDCSCTILWQEEEQAYVPVASWGYEPEEQEILRVLRVPYDAGRSLVARLVDEEVVDARVNVSAELFPDALLSQFGCTQVLCLALWRGQELSGVQVCGYRWQATRSQRDLRVARGISQIASLVLANTRLMKELQDANRFKDEFVGMMSHELRTPLHIIFGYIDLLQEGTFGPLGPEQTGSLTQARKSAQDLLEIVEAILGFNRLKRGLIALDLREVQLADLLATLAEETASYAYRDPAVTLQWPQTTAFPPLTTDPLKLKIIVKNLVTNALKFTHAGYVAVSVSWQEEDIQLKVEDTGSGMAPEVLPFIFRPFWQGDISNARHHRGIGLGLSLVHQLVEALGGKIEVTSEVGKGSTFRVTLPTVIRREQTWPPNRSKSEEETAVGS